MPSKVLNYLALIFICIVTVDAQELHYSNYHFTPLNVNPANAGAFSGSYRVSGIYSDKQASITPRPFRTFTLSADAPIVRGIRKQDWIGIGIEMDVVGKSGINFDAMDVSQEPGTAAKSTQSWTFMKIGAAYHFSLDKKQTNIITLGAQFINGSRDFNTLNQRDGRVGLQTGFRDLDIVHFNKGSAGGAGGSGNNSDRVDFSSYKDLSVGFLYKAKQKESELKLGFAMEGLLNPAVGFNSRGANKDSLESKYFGLNIHGSYELMLNKKTQLVPGFYYYSLGPANALNINTQAWYKIDPEKDFRAGAGVGLRNLRAAIIYLGAEFKDLRVGLAYDIDISSATIGSRSVGGFELSASYLGKIYKKPKPKPIIMCPRL
ncbi:MAG: PorP/SprF family type IX secretion system membrane protein [Saprospiraceae bacterium]|nr:PorP/SprF family type IX secretion system membrane protein [Saprospiraceae bacterium]